MKMILSRRAIDDTFFCDPIRFAQCRRLAWGYGRESKGVIVGTPGATLDLADGGLVYDYAGTTPVLAYVRDRAGYAAGTWTGPGILSSSAASSAGHWAVGFAEARDVLTFSGGVSSFMGTFVDDSAVIVRTTVLGDATLDGAVNFDDLLALAKHYNASGDAAVWAAGDFTYDGAAYDEDGHAQRACPHDVELRNPHHARDQLLTVALTLTGPGLF
jgi:hypothetical protein